MPDSLLTVDDPSVPSNAGLQYAEEISDIEVFDTRMSPADALKYQNPEYVEWLPYWEKYMDVYEARDIYKYIHQHAREHYDSYANRIKRGYYLNYSAGVVDLMVSYLYQTAITREVGDTQNSEIVNEFYEDADRRGTKFQVFMQLVATYAQVCGHVGVLVDMPKDQDIQTEADRQAARFRPYLSIVQCCQIVDWELDEFGKFEWVKLNMPTEQERDWRDPADEETETFVIWTKTDWEEWQVSGEEARMTARGDHNLGVVPLVIVRAEPSKSHCWFGGSSLRDIADINIAILNWCSLGDEETYNRCLNILTMERQEGGPPVEISHHNVLEYASGSKPPQFLTPGETPLKLIGEQIDRGRDEIYRLAKMGGSTGLLGVREATSGIAYAFEFNETNQSLARKADALEQGELEIHRLVFLWLTQETFTGDWTKVFSGSITYPREFGVEDFLTELQILLQTRTTLTSETAIKEVEKSVCRKFFAKSAQELREKIDQEIDSATDKMPKMPVGNINTMPMMLPQGQGPAKKPSQGPQSKPSDKGGSASKSSDKPADQSMMAD